MDESADRPSKEAIDYLRSVQAYYAGNISHLLNRPASRRAHYAEHKILQLRDVLFLSKCAELADISSGEADEIRLGFFTEYEDAISSLLLWKTSRMVSDAFKFLELRLPSGITFGTLPLELNNARQFRSPAGTPVITLNAGLLSYLFAMAKAVSLCIPFASAPDGKIYISSNEANVLKDEKGQDEFARRVALYLCSGYSGDPFEDITDFIDTHSFAFASQIYFYALVFIVAYEVAHISIRMPENKDQTASVTSIDVSVNELWRTEFHADEIALAVIRYLGVSMDNIKFFLIGVVAAKFFFYCRELVEFIKGPPDSGSHPSIEMRKRRMNLILMNPEPLVPEVSGYINLYATAISNSLEALIQQNYMKIIGYIHQLLGDSVASNLEWLTSFEAKMSSDG